MAFSAIEEEDRPTVIKRCYWPILRLAEEFPIGIEATGYTLDSINDLDPGWISQLRRLIEAGKVELVGSGAVQLIGPLVDPEVTRQNLRIGHLDYQRLLNCTPRLALINEQAYAPGLLPLYEQAGYESIMMDWAEAASHHPEWPSDLSHHPQRVAGAGSELPVIWSDAISFQKFQRYAHGELSAEEYFEFLILQQDKGVLALPLYTSDAEVFDYRPGRFTSEANLGSAVEYERVRLLLTAIQRSGVAKLVLPSDTLRLVSADETALTIETAAAPVTVKKQRKYNLLRWAVTGRSDLRLNTYCWRRLAEIRKRDDATDEDWRSLLLIWASDFRTHITETRWQKLQENLPLLPPVEYPISEPDIPASLKPNWRVDEQGRNFVVQTDIGHLVLNSYRGMAIQAFGFGTYEPASAGAPAANSIIGTLAHGYFDDIQFGADFYSGHMVFEPADAGKISDLGRCIVSHKFDEQLAVLNMTTSIKTGLGQITKTMSLSLHDHKLIVEYILPDELRLWGSLRLAHITLNPRAFDMETLFFASHNGGEEIERHELYRNGELLSIDHGRPVNKLVSGNNGLGMTGGQLLIGDSNHHVTITMDRTDAAGIGMIHCERVRGDFFTRAMISVRETDETSRKELDPLSPAIQTVKKRYSIALSQPTK